MKPFNYLMKSVLSLALVSFFFLSPVSQLNVSAANPDWVPVRVAAESIGAKVDWNQTEQLITIKRGNLTAIIPVGKEQALVNDNEIKMESSAIMKDHRTFISLSDFNAIFGIEANWNKEQQTVGFDATDLEGLSSLFIYQLFSGNVASLPVMMNEALKSNLPEQALAIIGQQYSAAYGKPIMQQSLVVENNGVHTNVVMVYETNISSLKITLRFDANQFIDDLYFEQIAVADTYQKPAYDIGNYSEIDVVIGEGTFAVPGTLTIPEGEGPFPSVVLVHGSGPHDRDSTIGAVKIFKDISVGLAAQNIATLRYEKVTKEHNVKVASLPQFTLKNESVDDSVLAVKLLKNRTDIDSANIYIVGHSQGGYVVPKIFENDKNNDIAGAILLSAPSGNMTDVLKEQQAEALDRLKTLGYSSEIIASQEQAAAFISQTVDLINDPQYSLEKLPESFPIPPAYWWYEQRDYLPSQVAKLQNERMLIIQGENDWQVSMNQFNGWKEDLKDRTNVSYISYPNINHVLTEYEELSIGTEYYQPSNVSGNLIADMAKWIKQ
ncbi:alpha/beta hydrolase family protein [Paenibacillus endoradicis]|uniref:alpha/beta hydrolase family protein n=1 Tax=Paenibacillus endoradicis TaxID=2972487 RepID=UPI0021590217|nr:stalk domain-containing protein [Paenibacillus endoradicis]MCR8660135.1 stalk domain-containing protein [Paenibacillus endoradicis]